MATLHSDCNSSIKSSTVAAKVLKLLSSPKLWADAIKIQKKKSLKNRLNNVGPDTDPRGTPVKICSKLPVALFIRTHCLYFQDINKCNALNFY